MQGVTFVHPISLFLKCLIGLPTPHDVYITIVSQVEDSSPETEVMHLVLARPTDISESGWKTIWWALDTYVGDLTYFAARFDDHGQPTFLRVGSNWCEVTWLEHLENFVYPAPTA